MENICTERIAHLREEMKKEGITAWLVTSADYHNSEYVAAYFKTIEFLCGFTGEAATLVILPEEADLWVDGRYFIQAEKEIKGSGATLQRMGEPGVPTVHAFLKEKMPDSGALGFDGLCVSKHEGTALHDLLAYKNVKLRADLDLIGRIWGQDRPALPSHPVFLPDEEKYAGETAADKLGRLREKLKEHHAQYYLTSKLDEIMWLYNIRGNDVEYNPVALSYAFVSMDHQYLFIQDSEVTDELREHAKKYDIFLHHYFALNEFLRKMKFDGKILFDPDYVSYAIYESLKTSVEEGTGRHIEDMTVEKPGVIDLMKAVKNPTEIRNFREVYIEDSAALTKFIFWIKQKMQNPETAKNQTELTAAEHLDELRAQISDYVELSFGTISAYGPNAAMMHYAPTKEDHAKLKAEGMLLVDSGGHYLRGTTDVTRTIALGPVTEEMKKDYTLTAISQLQLMGTQFLKGSCGMTLDIMAREPMWSRGMDYKCGTGHGIGNLLNVHEGPQTIRYRMREQADLTPFAPGMVTSDEPGVYKAGRYGIRIETILLCVDRQTTADGIFYGFEPLTFVPLERDLLDVRYLTPETRTLLNRYHKEVLEKIAPFLNDEERQWLEGQCAEI